MRCLRLDAVLVLCARWLCARWLCARWLCARWLCACIYFPCLCGVVSRGHIMLSSISPRRLTSVFRRQARRRDGCSFPLGRVHMRCGAMCMCMCVLGFLLASARRLIRGGPSLCDMLAPPLALCLSNDTGQICAFALHCSSLFFIALSTYMLTA